MSKLTDLEAKFERMSGAELDEEAVAAQATITDPDAEDGDRLSAYVRLGMALYHAFQKPDSVGVNVENGALAEKLRK